MRKTFFIAICLMITNICYPQKNNILSANRTGSIESAFTVPKNTLQIELGLSFAKIESEFKPGLIAGNPDYLQTDKIISTPEFMLRYGINDFIELRTGGVYRIIKSDIKDLNSDVQWKSNENEFENFTIGAKFQIQKEKNFIPQIALIAENVIPSFNSEENVNIINPKLSLSFSNSLSENLLLGYAGGVNIIKDGESNAFYSVSLKASIFKNFRLFTELFGTNLLNNGLTTNYLRGGLTYILQNNLQLDISGGKKLNKEYEEFYAGAGFIYRIQN